MGVGQEVAVPGCEACAGPVSRQLSIACGDIVCRSIAYWLASSRLSIGLTKSGLHERHAAMVKTGSKHRKTVPRISIYRR